MIFKYLKVKETGFTLIETLIAIAVLILVITGPIVLAAQSLKTASFSKNNLIASNLAQEGVELIRAYRANNVLGCNPSTTNCTTIWLNQILPPGSSECVTGNGCYIDSAFPLTLNKCSGGNYPNGCPLLKTTASGFYNYPSGTNSIFQRTIHVTQLNANLARVNVTISWQERYGLQTMVVEQLIDNWIQK